MPRRGYVYCHQIGTGEYEALGYDWRGFLIVPPLWRKTYKAAYDAVYKQLRG